MRSITRLLLAAGLFGLLWMAAPATSVAAVLFTLDQMPTGCTGCGPAPWGSVNVTQVSPSTLGIVVTLNAPYAFDPEGTRTHRAFVFNLAGSPKISYSNLTAGFSGVGGNSNVAANSVSQASFGSFQYGVRCASCESHVTTLAFQVTATSGSRLLTPLSLEVANAAGYFVSSSIAIRGLGANAAANRVVPEPASLALLGIGIIGVLVVQYRARPGRSAGDGRNA
jgi:PEP-CTERM motif